MKRYIDKDALVAEIKELKGQYIESKTRNAYEEGLKQGRLLGYIDVVNKVNSLEVKEVDLMLHTIIAEGCDWLAMNTNLSHDEIEGCRNLMLTVKEEQLKAQKGEEI